MLGEQRQTQQGQKQREEDSKQQQERQYEVQEGRRQQMQKQQVVYEQQWKEEQQDEAEEEEEIEQQQQQDEQRAPKGGEDYQQETEHRWEGEDRGVSVVGAAVAKLLQPPCSINEIAVLPCSSFSICCGALLRSCSLAPADAVAATGPAPRIAAALGEAGRAAAVTAAEAGQTGAAPRAAPAAAAGEFRRTFSTAPAATATAAAPPTCSSSKVSPAEALAAAAAPHKAPLQFPGSPVSGCSSSAATQHRRQQQQQQQKPHGQRQQQQGKQLPPPEGKWRQQRKQQQQKWREVKQQKTHQQQVYEERERDNECEQLQERQVNIQKLSRQRQRTSCPSDGMRLANAQLQAGASASPDHPAARSDTHATCPCISVVSAADDVEGAAAAPVAVVSTVSSHCTSAAAAAAAAVGAAAVAGVDAAGQPRWNLMLCSSCVPSVYAAAASILTAAAATSVRVPCAWCESCLAGARSFECPAAGAASFSRQRTLTTAAAVAAVHKQPCTAAAGRRRKAKMKEGKSEEAAGETEGEEGGEETKEGREAPLQCAAGPPASQRITATSTGHLAASLRLGAAECDIATAAAAGGDGESEAAAEGTGREAAAEGATAAAMVREAAALTGWMRLALLFNGEFPPALQLARLRLDAFVTAVAVVSLAGSSGLPCPQEQAWKRQQLKKVYMQEKRRQQQHPLQHKQQQQVQGEEHAQLPEQQHTESEGQQEHDQGMKNRTGRTLNSRPGAPNNSRIKSTIIHSSSCSESRSSSRSSGSTRNSNCSDCRARTGNLEGSGRSTVASTESSNCGRNAAGSSATNSCSSSSSKRGVSRSSTSSSVLMCWMCSSLAACAPALLPHRGELQQQPPAAADALPAQAADGFSVLKAVRLFFLEELRFSALLINQDPKSGVLWAYRRTAYTAAMRALLQLLLCRRRSTHTASVRPRPPGRRTSTINTRSRSDSDCKRSGNDSSSSGSSSRRRGKSSRSSGDLSSRYGRHRRRDICRRKGSTWSSVGRSCMPCGVNRSSSGSSRLCSSSGRSCVRTYGSTNGNCMPSTTGSGPLPGVSAPAAVTAARGSRIAGGGLTTVTATAEHAVAIPPVAAGAAAVEEIRAPAAIEEAGTRGVARGAATSSTVAADVYSLGTKPVSAAADGEGQKKQREDREKDPARLEHESCVGESGAVATSAAAAEEEKGRVAGACAVAAEGAVVRLALPVDAATGAAEAPVTDAVAEEGVATVAVKTDQEIPAAAGNARRVGDGEDVLDVFYELLDAELLLIRRQAEQRLHAYHPWEHLARLLPLWREFELSAAALLHADVSGKIDGRKRHYAAAHARIHSDIAAASSTVYKSAAATAAACRRAAPATLPHSSGECAAYEKGVQPVTVETESYTFSPQSVSKDESHCSESFCVREGGVPPYENPVTAAVKCTATPAPSQRCAAKSAARLPVDCCHAVVDASTKYFPYVDTVNKASGSMHVDVCDSNLCRSLRESSTVDTTEENKRELEINMGRPHPRAVTEESMRQKGAAAAVEGHVIAAKQQSAEAAAVAACDRKASSAANPGAGIASITAVAAEKEQVAAVKDPHSIVAAASNQEQQQHGSWTPCESKAVVAYSDTHADADREVRRRHGSHKVAPLTTKERDEDETEEGNKEGREATEEDKGTTEEGGEETSGVKGNVDALQRRMAEEENIGEGGRSSDNEEQAGKERKSYSGVEQKAKKTRKIVEERVDSFLQHQTGMLPQCRAPYHVLARRFYEKMQSCMKLVDRCLSRILSTHVAAGNVNSLTPARVSGMAAGIDCGVPAPSTSPVLSSSPTNHSSAAVSVAAQSRCLSLSSPARSAVRALSGPTSVAALHTAAAAARTAPENSDEPPPPMCAAELHERRCDNDASPLLLWQPPAFRARPGNAVFITDSSNDICNSSPVTHGYTTAESRRVFTPHEDGTARVHENTLLPGQNRQALPAALSHSVETALGCTSENNDVVGSAGVTAPKNKEHLLLQSTSLCAHGSGFSDVIRVQEQLLAQYLGTNYQIIKLFPHFEAPWSGRSDLYTAYLRVWRAYVVNVQRRILLYRPDCRNSLQETRRRPKKSQEQQQGIVGGTVGERTLEPCASRVVSGGVAEASAKCGTDEHFQLGTDRASVAVARVKILYDLVLSFVDAVQHHLRYVVMREVKTTSLLVSIRKQVQRTPTLPLKQPGTGEQLGTATRRKEKLAVPESTGGESEAEKGPMTRWLSRHLCRLGRDLDRTLERLRLAARELRDGRAKSSPFFSVENEADTSYLAASWSVDTEAQQREDCVIG